MNLWYNRGRENLTDMEKERAALIRIVSLVDNVSASPEYAKKHGLSLYIETERHKILYDLGPNDCFLKNAAKLGVNIADVDTVIISHGHFDHGGGLPAFLKANDKAKIYIHKAAFGRYYMLGAGFLPVYVGLKPALAGQERLAFTEDCFKIDDELTLFAGVRGRELYSAECNRKLLVRKNGRFAEDPFEHEQYLILTDGDARVLFTGCSHNGIVNIIEEYRAHYASEDAALSCVIGGFHLYNIAENKYEATELIRQLAQRLDGYDAIDFYTCHCTGERAYDSMKQTLGDRLAYLPAGARLTFPAAGEN